MKPRHLRGAAAGIVADRALGEPPLLSRHHPVSMFGSLMLALEGRFWRDRPGARLAGTAFAATGITIGAIAGGALRSTGAATYIAVAGRLLHDTATEAGEALRAGDIERARELLPALAGRDPSALDERGAARAVIESVAENTVDAVVAPALWAAMLGAPGALGYRAANTLDSMVGHRSARYEQFGWASARLDDLAGWVPARVTAVLVAAVRPSAAPDVWRAVTRDAPAHPSPNAGVAEAAFAAALGMRLGGTNRYGDRVEHRPGLGTGRAPLTADIARAVDLSRDVSLGLACALAASSYAPSAARWLSSRAPAEL